MSKVLILSILFFLGCSVKYPKVEIVKTDKLFVKKLNQDKIEEIQHLYNQLIELSENVSIDEAQNLASSIVVYSMYLSNKYKLVSPPNFQNFLVNIKIKERGLCYQWMYDLSSFIGKNRYETFDFYYAVDNLNTIFEHNVFVITAKKELFESGIVIDPWRNSGAIHSVKIEDDKNYKWTKRVKVFD
jgi:hypothetical protein